MPAPLRPPQHRRAGTPEVLRALTGRPARHRGRDPLFTAPQQVSPAEPAQPAVRDSGNGLERNEIAAGLPEQARGQAAVISGRDEGGAAVVMFGTEPMFRNPPRACSRRWRGPGTGRHRSTPQRSQVHDLLVFRYSIPSGRKSP
ncbi:hypothetical protein GCM10027203_26430 [Nonomuraea fastidiosa]